MIPSANRRSIRIPMTPHLPLQTARRISVPPPRVIYAKATFGMQMARASEALRKSYPALSTKCVVDRIPGTADEWQFEAVHNPSDAEVMFIRAFLLGALAVASK